ncbi:MAG: restriction endonuclease subunit S [Anaerolineaceae bacterium]|nr:restriction endonuclease subunit S [Anaerolineaceae bacterium]
MKQEKKRQLTPKLRFPEFRDAPEWEEKQLKDISSSIFDGTHQTPTYTTEGVPFYSVENIISGNKNKFISRDDYIVATSKNKPEKGDILFTRIGKIGYTQVVTWDHDFSVYVTLAVIKQSKSFDSYYLHCFMQSNRYQAEIRKKSLLNAVPPKINMDSLRDTEILLPEPSEQQRIADCLASLDELITAQNQKLDTLKDHKKGMLQQLFPAEGNTLPQLRFPEFQDTRDWENEPLGVVYSFKVTNSLSRDKLNYKYGSVKNIHYGDIHTKFSTLFDIENEIVPFINPSESLGKIKLESYCIEGDMIFADASEDLEDVGKSIEIVHLNNEKLVSGLHTLLARQKKKKIIVGFGGYLFKSNRIRTQIMKEAQGAKVLGISAGRLSNIEICFPSDKKEQQKIADCLSSIDELIAAQTQKRDVLNAYKKGLMQQLFPLADEVWR